MYSRILKNLNFYLKKESRKIRALVFKPSYTCVKKVPKFSAYLSIYNDADILERTLESIRDYVNELIVVDGAYEWNSTYLEAIGLNPQQSEESVYAILDRSGIPYKTIKKVWKNEVEKRIAGYEATSSRYVMRVDADEVLFFDSHVLEYFINSDCAVAEMYMPNYASPGYVIRGNRLIDRYRIYPRQACLFDRTKIDEIDHLKYLWLVLTADELPKSSKEQLVYPVFEKPIAFCAHLTNWRSVESSKLRASFYTMNWMRKNGAPWLAQFGNYPIDSFDEFFDAFPPKDFLELMRNSLIAQGDIKLKKNEFLEITPLKNAEEQKIIPIYEQFIKSISSHTLSMRTRSSISLNGYDIYIDIGSKELWGKMAKLDGISIQFESNLSDVDVELLYLSTEYPYSHSLFPEYEFDGVTLTISIDDIRSHLKVIRRAIKIRTKTFNGFSEIVKFKIL